MLRSHNGIDWKKSLVDSIPGRKLKGYLSLKEKRKLGILSQDAKSEKEVIEEQNG